MKALLVLALLVVSCLAFTQDDLQGSWTGTYYFQDFYDPTNKLFCASATVSQTTKMTVSGTKRTTTYGAASATIGGVNFNVSAATVTGGITVSGATVLLTADGSTGTYCDQFTFANNVLTWGGSIENTSCIALPTATSCNATANQATFYVTYTKDTASTTSAAGALTASLLGLTAVALLL